MIPCIPIPLFTLTTWQFVMKKLEVEIFPKNPLWCVPIHVISLGFLCMRASKAFVCCVDLCRWNRSNVSTLTKNQVQLVHSMMILLLGLLFMIFNLIGSVSTCRNRKAWIFHFKTMHCTRNLARYENNGSVHDPFLKCENNVHGCEKPNVLHTTCPFFEKKCKVKFALIVQIPFL